MSYSTEFQRERRKAIARDQHQCVKCGGDAGLHAHHIQPRDQGGPDTMDNLMTLCAPCHREWELIAYGNIALDDWLKLLPLTHILRLIARPDCWREDITASAMRKMMAADIEIVSEGWSAILG